MSAESASVLSEAPARSRSRRPVVFALLALAVLIGAVFGILRWVHGWTHVATDNAQVEGHVIPILTRVGGFVADVAVEENQSVSAGKVLVRIDDRDLRARLEQTEGDLANALAVAGAGGKPGQAAAQLQAAQAAVVQAEAAAQRNEDDLKRYRSLAEL